MMFRKIILFHHNTKIMKDKLMCIRDMIFNLILAIGAAILLIGTGSFILKMVHEIFVNT